MDNCSETSDASSDKTISFRIRPIKKTISHADKTILVEAMERGENFYALGKQMGITRNTVKSIIYLYKKTGRIFGGKGIKRPMMSEEISEIVLNFVDQNYWSTLEEIRKYLAGLNYDILVDSISRCLKKNLSSFNKFRLHTEEKNSESILELRKTYVQRMLEEEWNDKKTIYIDECYFNTWGSKIIGRNKIGNKRFKELPSTVVPNICLVLAMGVNGLIHHKLLIESFDKESYKAFFNDLIAKLNGKGFIFIHVNVPIHKENYSTDFQIEKLPPLSPFLNPIDGVFTKIKQNVRKSVSNIYRFTTMNINSRFIFLSDAINNELMKKDYSNLKNYFKEIRTFFPKSILKERDN